ncbi:MAG: Bug family tripartite tricarboxylate transporter substrate binding protein [Thermodesulfobacteriota bacterium]
MKKQVLCLAMVLFVVLLLVSSKTVLAAPYYEGKTVRIIVGFAPGGGYDRIARLLAKYLPKYIPGKPVVLVENMEGASSIIAANYIYNQTKPDGLNIGTFNRGLPFAQLLKTEGVRYDVTKFSWIGSAAVEATILAMRSDLPYKTVDDLRKAKEPIPLAGMGPGTSDTQFAILLKEFAKINLKLIIYPSSADGMLAIERKEVDGRGGSYSSLKPFIERGLVRPMIRGRVAEPGIENLPVNEDLTTDPKGKTIMAMLASADGTGRPYVVAPGTPAQVMNILRDAFAKVAKDPDLREEAKKSRMEVSYTSGDECLKVLNYLLNQPKDIVEEFGKYIKF